MLLAELEVWHTRPLAPTRRVALGNLVLPVDPAPGFGGLLLGAVVAGHMAAVDDDLVPDVHRLIGQVEADARVVQPRLRHRFQVDRHGLALSTHRLIGDGEEITFDFHTTGSGLAQVLGAIYAVERLGPGARHVIAPVLHKAMRWRGTVGPALIAHLAGTNSTALSTLADPRAWAMDVLGFPPGTPTPSKKDVTAQFRLKMRSVHPGPRRRRGRRQHRRLRAGRGAQDPHRGRARPRRSPEVPHLLLFPGAGASRDQSTLVALDRGLRPAGRPCGPTSTTAGRAGGRPIGRPSCSPPCGVSWPRSTTTGSWSVAARWAAGSARWSPGPPTASRHPRRSSASWRSAIRCTRRAGRDQLRVEHLPAIAVPCLFVHGTADPFGTPDELQRWTATISGPVTHHFIDGGRHDLKGKDPEVVETVRAWLADL